jgi:hypothetical protein
LKNAKLYNTIIIPQHFFIVFNIPYISPKVELYQAGEEEVSCSKKGWLNAYEEEDEKELSQMRNVNKFVYICQKQLCFQS